MSEKMKSHLAVTIIGTLIVFAFAAVGYVKVYKESVEPFPARSFSASGEGKVVAVPDIAQFTFSVITEGGKNLSDLQKQNTDKVNNAINFIKTNGIDAKDIKTQNYDVVPRYQYYSCNIVITDCSDKNSENCFAGGRSTVCPPPEIVGYTISQTVLIKIRDFVKIGDVLSGVVQNGANSVSELTFTIDDPTKLKNQARAEAITKAIANAKVIAKAGGFRIGKIISIDEGYQSSYYDYSAKGGAAALSYAAESVVPSPAIEPGSQEITVDLNMVFEIK